MLPKNRPQNSEIETVPLHSH